MSTIEKPKKTKKSRARRVFKKMGGVISFISLRHHGEHNMVPSRQVRTRNGLVEGFRLKIDGEKEVDLFLGIPFAKPPVGELRFKNPEHAEDWDGVKKCIRFGPRAPQADFFWERFTLGVGKSEDCLYLNVFAPTWKAEEVSNGLHPVMVYVHGGGFLIDSAVKYGDEGIAKYLCRHGVVVVTIQYRLGLLGFFSTGDEVCPGNLGLWDMTMALQWVRDNVHAFGGDPRKVTVFGQSAGGASVDLLSISPHSKDLFHQVIPMAGNAECEWSTVGKNRLTHACRDFAYRKCWDDKENIEQNPSENMLSFLRTKKDKEFEKRLLTRKGVDVSKIGLDLAPVIGSKPSDFLPKSLDDLRKEAPKKNIMIGTCEHEGLLFASLGPNNFDEKGIDKLLALLITEENHQNFEELREEAKALYMKKDEEDKEAITKGYIELYSDIFVNNGTYIYAEKMTELGNRVFMYSFDYCNPRSFGILSLRAPFRAATHCTELAYIFGVSIVFNYRYNEADNHMLDLMTRMWTNFAKYGNPNGQYEDSTVFDFKWDSTNKENPTQFLKITDKKCEMQQIYHNQRAEFWKKIRISAKNS
ncbi:unnamed protein product [Caenorhabditis angaria]|uniref:Carboxylic ester hydrolase n=1 Tax=Caenorhabditis angaria TaxID=860376 RepID=A0A9P1J539_9PELO|nr:unnamed protein product [Caenorhabditis angaria]